MDALESEESVVVRQEFAVHAFVEVFVVNHVVAVVDIELVNVIKALRHYLLLSQHLILTL